MLRFPYRETGCVRFDADGIGQVPLLPTARLDVREPNNDRVFPPAGFDQRSNRPPNETESAGGFPELQDEH